MEIREALELARTVLQTGERVELVPAADGAEVYIIKRRKANVEREGPRVVDYRGILDSRPLLFFYRKETLKC